MAMSRNHNDRDFQSYFQMPDGSTARKVHDPMGYSGSILAGISYDSMQASYPTASSEVYSYFLNSVLVATVTVTYSNNSKHEIVSIVRS